MPGGLQVPEPPCDMVLALVALDAVVGVSLLVDGVRSGSSASRRVGAGLLLCAAVLRAAPRLAEA
jgi:hypothetical protein